MLILVAKNWKALPVAEIFLVELEKSLSQTDLSRLMELLGAEIVESGIGNPSENSEVKGIYPQQMIFRVGAKPLSNRSVHEVHEDCEVGAGNNPENSEVKGIVVPRFGTTSPWSSKATEIAKLANLPVERIERGWIHFKDKCVYDRMTQTVVYNLSDLACFFSHDKPRTYQSIPLLSEGRQALVQVNQALGLALSDVEINYLFDNYSELGRDPTDVELMMFAQANSEHCRHKIFRASWDNQEDSLFGLIKKTSEGADGLLSAYEDNAAVLTGYAQKGFYPDEKHCYRYVDEARALLIKVETHNHPTAIEPFEGAATGSGGEIRDEGATGRGGKPIAGLCGFTVSHLRIPGLTQPWELDINYPARISTSLEIMLKGPIGAAAFNNEFGRPNLCGYFRTFEATGPCAGQSFGYHKPVMLAGGIGHILPQQVEKQFFPAGTPIVVMGGPAMLIGLGGGAASSMTQGQSDEQLDFASVQRSNAEIERRCQEVIDRCWALKEGNPILSIHDVGAGGLSNALPELVHATGQGATFNLRAIPSAEPGLSPLEIWCNEAQERYVLAIEHQKLEQFLMIAKRERCPVAVVGYATESPHLKVEDPLFENAPIDLPMSVLLGKLPLPQKSYQAIISRQAIKSDAPELSELISRVLQFPAVADKSFLITIADRTVGGLVHRDQMVGPYQIPVADCAVMASSYLEWSGQAMSIGERPAIALVDPAAASRMALGEAITNLCAASIRTIKDIKCSGNWMANCQDKQEESRLYLAVEALSRACVDLGIAIPVGKDSLSMKTAWHVGNIHHQVSSPVTLNLSAFAPVDDIRQSLTPELMQDVETTLLLIDLGQGLNRLGGSVYEQITLQQSNTVPDLDQVQDLASYFDLIQSLNDAGKILAYHDRSDGGLLVTLLEMAFTAQVGIEIVCDDDPISFLLNEELGAVIQVKISEADAIIHAFKTKNIPVYQTASLIKEKECRIQSNGRTIYKESIMSLHQLWSKTSYRLQALRDNPDCAKEAFEAIESHELPKLFSKQTFEILKPTPSVTQKPRVAILREQGVNGHLEMAAAFHHAGFEAIDLHMSDLLLKPESLLNFQVLAVCGGFSYGDVLGAGLGWAKAILYHDTLKAVFSKFFENPNTLTLGVCNGCQMLAGIREVIPGTEHWPRFVRNTSRQFEARLSMVEIQKSHSLFLQGMSGSQLPIVVSHGEGHALFEDLTSKEQVTTQQLVVLKYINPLGVPTERYPHNPNGSPEGITGLTTRDGRITMMMPHPERVFRTAQFSWAPKTWSVESPWMQLFYNARKAFK
ncbi:MAG: phosphoribosylformylglycinamidine synthase [Gammaproteobacteria bacterium]